MEPTYQPAAAEARLRARWRELNLGAADPTSGRPAFSIALPPPNITGSLHMGHALNLVIQDALCRYHRMRGFEVCWVPGTDHAAIATQNVIERQLAAEGTSKEELGREAFGRRVDDWYRTYRGRIREQMEALGASCDWGRERFTLDPEYVRVIRIVFGELYRQGLIYRGPRIVNWCPRCRSAISDEEVTYQEQDDTFYFVRYRGAEGGEGLVVATTRPETILADVAVAVAPGDERYRSLLGTRVLDPLDGRELPVLEDRAVDPKLGTGALKITPGHSADDYEVGQRHELPILTVISLDGMMIAPRFPDLDGRPVAEARELAAQRLRAGGAMVREEPLRHQVGHCDRCGTVIEPLVTPQWWVRVRPLADPAAEVVEQDRIEIHPHQFRAQYLDWLAGLRDWCISRQLWLGHRIPVSTCANGHRFAWVEEPDCCPECGSLELEADPDVLDTWFSSALWPFATLGWPDPNPAFDRFYPTSVLSTAREILQHWVVRMVMTGLRFTAEIPFHDVLFHATILGEDGARMAKSRGNVVDPLDMARKHGADALRAWAASVAMGTQDARFDETRLAGFAKFANKLWNMNRLLQQSFSRAGAGELVPAVAEVPPEELQTVDRWILSRLARLTRTVTHSLDVFDFGEAISAGYDFAWHELADWYLELVKGRLEAADPGARFVTRLALLRTSQLLHPIVPFLTDALAEHYEGAPASLDLATWPEPAAWEDAAAEASFGAFQGLVMALRHWLQELGVPSHRGGERLPFAVLREGPELSFPEAREYLQALLPVRWVAADGDLATRPQVVAGATTLALGADLSGSAPDWRAGLGRELLRVSSHRESLERKLAGPFAVKAAPQVVAGVREQLDRERLREELLRGVFES